MISDTTQKAKSNTNGTSTSERPSAAKATTSFLKSYGKTWISMTPIYLMSEAVIPGKQFGGSFKKNRKELTAAAQAFAQVISTSASDVIIIVNEQLTSTNEETKKTGALIKAAGEHGLILVTSNLDKAKERFERSGPGIKKSIQKNGRDVIVVIDKSLKNPLVVTSISRFARSKGIPATEAAMQLASLALSKILAAIPVDEDDLEDGEVRIDELDASELERTSTKEAEREAVAVGVAGQSGTSDRERKESACCVS